MNMYFFILRSPPLSAVNAPRLMAG